MGLANNLCDLEMLRHRRVLLLRHRRQCFYFFCYVPPEPKNKNPYTSNYDLFDFTGYAGPTKFPLFRNMNKEKGLNFFLLVNTFVVKVLKKSWWQSRILIFFLSTLFVFEYLLCNRYCSKNDTDIHLENFHSNTIT